MAFKHERIPRGYERDDYPLPHIFFYNFKLGCASENANKCITTFLRSSTLAINPANVTVNPKNSAFAVDTGPLICDGSVVNRIKISTLVTATENMLDIDKLSAMAYYYWNIHGAFEDAWTPADKLTTTTTAQLLHVTSDATNDDVVPEVTANNLGGVNQPASNKTGTEVFGTYNLSVDLTPENTTTDVNMLQEIYDAKSYYSNAGKLNSLMGHINRRILSRNKIFYTMFEDRFTPRQCRSQNPHMFFGRQYFCPNIGDPAQVLPSATATAQTQHMGVIIKVQFNEWNKNFLQGAE